MTETVLIPAIIILVIASVVVLIDVDKEIVTVDAAKLVAKWIRRMYSSLWW